ncbi:MAG: hypothetical protein E7038_08350 [Lentisphaerae bacterium]|nr:hypothetical protein [Lentisphaerota bacterium]
MTVDRALTAEERRRSQNTMRDQRVLSALAANCGSETLLILLALSLGIPETIVSATGSLQLFSYTFLPLGFLLAARMGAVRSISRFHLLTGFIYLVIAAACFVPHGAWLLLPAWILLQLIFKLLQIFGNESGMDLFRSYFLVTAFLFAGLICAPFSLVLKKRKAD